MSEFLKESMYLLRPLHKIKLWEELPESFLGTRLRTQELSDLRRTRVRLSRPEEELHC